MIYVLLETEDVLSPEERSNMARLIRERLQPVQDQFPDFDMTATWTQEGIIRLNSSHPELLQFAKPYLAEVGII